MDNKEYIKPSTEALQLLSVEQARFYNVVPFYQEDKKLQVYATAVKEEAAEEIEILTGREVVFEIVPELDLKQLLTRHYRKESTRDVSSVGYQGDATVFVKKVISEAKELGSSDIHLEIYENDCRVRVRIDGKLIERYVLDKKDYPTIINKVKILSNLDISEKRLPQDGRIFFEEEGSKFDIRVSVLPTLHGEKCVMRILSNDATNIDIRKLGFSEKELSDYNEGVIKPHGLLLISGPTGSGKTTTLYATLKELNKITSNIITIEDPIEYTLKGINQVQLRSDIGLDFPSAMRTFLRQDPDVIMVGEIRDADTANMAIRAALTGHLVLSTIHTNSAWGIVSRLIDMGVPAYLIAGTLNTAVAQRLVRKLCSSCKEKKELSAQNLPPRFTPTETVEEQFVPVGCEECHYTGYSGRQAIYEVVSMDHELTDAIRQGAYNIEELLEQRNIKTLSQNAFQLLKEGVTSLEEVYPMLLNI